MNEFADAHQHRALRELLGTYVLGQLDGDDEVLVRDHLDSCSSCRAEARSLSPLATSLRSVDPDRLGPVAEPPASLGDRVMQTVRRDRQRQRRRVWLRRGLTAAAVAASLVIAFTLGALVRPGGPALPPGQPLPVTAASGVHADAELVRHTWGTELRLVATGLVEGDPYQVRFVTDSGTDVSAGSIIGTGPATLTCSLNAAVPLDNASRLLITDSSGSVVLDARI